MKEAGGRCAPDARVMYSTFLDWLRRSIVGNFDGVDEGAARRRMLPSPTSMMEDTSGKVGGVTARGSD